MADGLLGWLGVVVACLGFGSNYLPVKQVDVRDGWFYTVWLAVGIWLVGLAQWLVGGCYHIELFAALGGAIWSTGNLLVPFIIKRCGLGVGQLIWGCTNMLTGWACGAFGLFGKDRDVIAHRGMNYAGVGLAVLALGLFALMKPDRTSTEGETELRELVLDGEEGAGQRSGLGTGFPLGCGMALVAGLFFGSSFNPATYLQQQGMADRAAGLPSQEWRHSPEATNYVFPQFCGILVSTLVYFGVACSTTPRKLPYMQRDVVLPGLASGILWGIADVGFFKANSALSFVISFPIICAVPGVIAALWGALLWNENSGTRNRALLLANIVLQAVAVSLIAMSKA